MKLISQIIITQDFFSTYKILASEFAAAQLCVYPPLESPRAASISDIALIEHDAFLRSERERLFILAFSELSAIVQNRLLKLLEEPPAGVFFAILTRSKNTLLPTIKSRLITRNLSQKESAKPYDIDFHAISEQDIAQASFEDELATVCARLLASAKASKIRLDIRALLLFEQAFRLANSTNASAPLIQTALLLQLARCAKNSALSARK